MAIRKIIEIDEEKCTGCGLCIPSCAEGALQIVDGKAKLVKDIYCDGLGACLGECPEGALKIIEREADEFDEAATEEYLKSIGRETPSKVEEEDEEPPAPFQCPGSKTMSLGGKSEEAAEGGVAVPSRLCNWPVKIELAAPQAPFFKNASLLVAADCAPFAYGNFHNDVLQGKAAVIGCPKLSDGEDYIVDKAIELSGKDILKKKIVIGIKGNIVDKT
jgi:NAD-dependent dihydropyrimidine dehydrogenase PreA subunit